MPTLAEENTSWLPTRTGRRRASMTRSAAAMPAVMSVVSSIKDREFVSTNPRERVLRPDASAQPLRRLHEQQVSGPMTEAVVDQLKAVQVEEQDCAAGTGTVGCVI